MGSSSARKKVLASQIVANAAEYATLKSRKFPHFEHHSCSAISLQAALLAPGFLDAYVRFGTNLRRRYGNLFSPVAPDCAGNVPYFWLDDRFIEPENSFKTLQERNEWRITALCLFSAMLKAEEAEEKEAAKKSRVKKKA